MTGAARVFAGGIALLAWVGLAVQFYVLFVKNGSVMETIGVRIVYFTILTNLLVAVLFTGYCAGLRAFGRPLVVAGTGLSILLVGVVYHLLLRGLQELSGGSQVANVLLHQVTPVVVPVFWLLFVAKGRLRWIDPLVWAVYPLAYLAYALVWGGMHGRYPYPFLNVGALGWSGVAVNALGIAVGFLVVAWGVVGVDCFLGERAQR